MFRFFIFFIIFTITTNYAISSSFSEEQSEKSLKFFPKRKLEQIVYEIHEDLNRDTKNESSKSQYIFTAYSDNWILEIKKESENNSSLKIFRIYGYDFPLNEASVAAICNDKAACSQILIKSIGKENCVEHELFLNPSKEGYVPDQGIIRSLIGKSGLESGFSKVVVKRKDGSGGANVFLVENVKELERAAFSIFSKGYDLCLSPYYNVSKEFRVILLDDQPQIVFNKIRPHIIGDGNTKIETLIANFVTNNNLNQIKFLKNLSEKVTNRFYKTPPLKGEIIPLNWKHNLGQGGIPKIVETNDSSYRNVTELAQKAAQSIGLRFGSVDVIETEGFYKILEINSGVMMENFIKHYDTNNKGYQIAFNIYKKAVCSYFSKFD